MTLTGRLSTGIAEAPGWCGCGTDLAILVGIAGVRASEKGTGFLRFRRYQIAFQYQRPSSFSRGLRLDFGEIAVLLISGTASVGPNGETLHTGDFRAQTRRTFANIAALLESEGATWKNVVRTTCYLRDIERDYAAFNEERTAFYQSQELDPLPAVRSQNRIGFAGS